MSEPYQDPAERDRPKPIRHRTGSFPIRASSGDNQHLLPTGARHVRRMIVDPSRAYVDEPVEYTSAVRGYGNCLVAGNVLTLILKPLPHTPAFFPQASFSSDGQPQPQQAPGFLYQPYGYAVDPRVIQARPLNRRRDTGAYEYPQPYAGLARAAVFPALYAGEQTRPPRPRSRSRSRSRSRTRSIEQFSDIYGGDSGRQERTARASSPDVDSSGSESSSQRARHYDSDDMLDGDELIAAKVYEFRPSRLSKSPSRDNSIGANGSDADGPLLEAERSPPNQSEGPSASKTARTLQIYRSEYTGDAFADGSHSARLTAIHDPKKTREPIFRWM